MFAKNNPELFLELANDENVHLETLVLSVLKLGIINFIC